MQFLAHSLLLRVSYYAKDVDDHYPRGVGSGNGIEVMGTNVTLF